MHGFVMILRTLHNVTTRILARFEHRNHDRRTLIRANTAREPVRAVALRIVEVL